MPPLATDLLDYAVAGRPIDPSGLSGDMYAVLNTERGLLVALVDGLGHGADAARAARHALAAIDEAPDRPLPWLIEDCHAALRATRGVAIVLAALDRQEREMDWCSVGNVDGVVVRSGANGSREREMILMRGGIVGHRLPPPRLATVPIEAGDLLILATDGIGTGFVTDVVPSLPVQQIADTILARYAKPTDDALVLVGRIGAATVGCRSPGSRRIAAR